MRILPGAKLDAVAHEVFRHLARWRMRLGFAAGFVVLWLAEPTWTSLAAGSSVAAIGEFLRIWAAGHLEKGREVTRSGPYRLIQHPLYVGSTVMAIGLIVASRRLSVAVIVVAYLLFTLTAAIRGEEAWLATTFGEEYASYREGRASASDRRFSFARAVANREHRTVAGLITAMALLSLKAG